MRALIAVAAALATAMVLTGCGPEASPSVPASEHSAEPAPTEAEPAPTAAEPSPTAVAPSAADRPQLWSAVDPSADADRDCAPYSLERDYVSGELSVDDFTRYAWYGMWGSASVPEMYRPCPEVSMLSTGGAMWALQFLDVVGPELSAEIADQLTPQVIDGSDEN